MEEHNSNDQAPAADDVIILTPSSVNPFKDPEPHSKLAEINRDYNQINAYIENVEADFDAQLKVKQQQYLQLYSDKVKIKHKEMTQMLHRLEKKNEEKSTENEQITQVKVQLAKQSR